MIGRANASSFSVHADVKDLFFDRAMILQKIGRENARRLGRVGAFVRQRARTAILRRAPKARHGKRRHARPGSPPLVHSNDSFATLRNILFYLDRDWETVIIGPRAVKSLKLKNASKDYVPGLLELGGTSTISQTLMPSSGEWVTIDPKYGKEKGYEQRTVKARYKKFPFMGPALEAERKAGTLAGLWASSGG
jgi:hypothetical protein